MRRGIVSVMIVVGSLAWAAPAVAGPQPIALARGGDLYAFRLDRGMWRLTDSPARESVPAWSPDHRSLAFVAWSRRLVTLDLRTRVRRRIVRMDERYDRIEAVTWSPDGARIAFATVNEFRRGGGRSLCGQVWTIRVDGTDLTKILGGQELVTGLSWGPDGTWIAASAEWPNGVDACREGVQTGILRFASHGGDIRWVSGALASQLDLSSDGRRLVYRGWSRTCHACGEVWRSASDGAGAHVIAMPPNGVAGLLQPRFSPNGRKVVLLASAGAARYVWIMRADGSHPHRLGPRADGLDW
jgi:Tol biopolymer transport system component